MVRLWRFASSALSTSGKRVSIPQWFDCGWPKEKPFPATFIGFNPTMVRLWQGKRDPRPHPWPCFNPTMVRLWRFVEEEGVRVYDDVSIPQWFDCGTRIG